LCGADDYEILFKAGEAQVNQVVQCRHCSLMYANPRSQEADVVLIKQYDPKVVLEKVAAANKWREEKETLQVRDYRDTRAYLSQLFPQRGSLIEVGSGLGYLLEFFRQDGWSPFGVEPSAGLCSYAESRFGIRTFAGTLEEAQLPEASAEVVTMIHVIEHVPDPLAVLREIHRVLKPGGCLVLETPRYDSLMFRLLGKRERSLSCDGHIYFFTTPTLEAMARSAGFTVLKNDIVGRSLTFARLIYNIGVISKSQRVRRGLDWVSKKLGLNKATLSLNMRDMQRLYLAKTES
jgi:2-polyprenyl-3-methyl-5-hydroxy-6-metoxy-1,4-benzoquinol methylase